MLKYFKYVITNEEPVRIADDSRSQSGQTETLHYITGSAIRGMIVYALTANQKTENYFTEKKAQLFSANTRFLNAYPAMRIDGKEGINSYREMIPAPMGFYARKGAGQEKEIQNVVATGVVDPAMKRARIGDFAYIKDGCVYGASVKTGSDLKIKKKYMKKDDDSQSVFRNQYIERGYVFAGYIVTEDDIFAEYIEELFRAGNAVYLGNGKSAGSGRCRVLCSGEVKSIDYAYAAEGDLAGQCYMLLLSDTVMKNALGEYCGLDIGELQSILGVSGLQIVRCATSGRSVRGYNSTWKTRIPSVPMYQKGSVFLLKYDGTIPHRKALEVMDSGIGIRRNEGFGRILFMSGYENIETYRETELYMEKGDAGSELSDDDKSCLRVAAKAFYRRKLESAMPGYIITHAKDIGGRGVSNSVLGVLESYTTAYRYQYDEAVEVIEKYLVHAVNKQEKMRVQKTHTDFKKIKKRFDEILNLSRTGLEEVLEIEHRDTYMQIPVDELISDAELGEYKLEILTGMIRYYNKKKTGEA